MPSGKSTPSFGSRAQRGVLALFSALALALLTASQAFPVLHFAFVQHQLCAEHGSLEHGQPLASQPHAVNSSESTALPSSQAADEHEHCAVQAISSARCALSARDALLDVRFERAPAPACFPWDLIPSPVPLLAYAPKLAPPV